MFATCETESRKHLLDTRFVMLYTGHIMRHKQIFQHRKNREQVKLLKNNANALPAKSIASGLCHCINILFGNMHTAL